jgi:hypothetical protein
MGHSSNSAGIGWRERVPMTPDVLCRTAVSSRSRDSLVDETEPGLPPSQRYEPFECRGESRSVQKAQSGQRVVPIPGAAHAGRTFMRKSTDDVIMPVVAFVIWAAAFSFVVVHFR